MKTLVASAQLIVKKATRGELSQGVGSWQMDPIDLLPFAQVSDDVDDFENPRLGSLAAILKFENLLKSSGAARKQFVSETQNLFKRNYFRFTDFPR